MYITPEIHVYAFFSINSKVLQNFIVLFSAYFRPAKDVVAILEFKPVPGKLYFLLYVCLYKTSHCFIWLLCMIFVIFEDNLRDFYFSLSV